MICQGDEKSIPQLSLGQIPLHDPTVFRMKPCHSRRNRSARWKMDGTTTVCSKSLLHFHHVKTTPPGTDHPAAFMPVPPAKKRRPQVYFGSPSSRLEILVTSPQPLK